MTGAIIKVCSIFTTWFDCLYCFRFCVNLCGMFMAASLPRWPACVLRVLNKWRGSRDFGFVVEKSRVTTRDSERFDIICCCENISSSFIEIVRDAFIQFTWFRVVTAISWLDDFQKIEKSMRLTQTRSTVWMRLARRTLSYQCILTLARHSATTLPLVASFSLNTSQRIRIDSRRFSSINLDPSIQTYQELQMTKDSRKIVESAIEAVDPVSAVKESLTVVDGSKLRAKGASGTRDFDLRKYDRVIVIAFGKASSAMSTAVLDRLEQVSRDIAISGLVIVKDGHATAAEQERLSSRNIHIREASHPVPDQRSVDASEEVLQLVRSGAESERKLVIACISGGGSALFCAPSEDLTLADLQATNTALLQSGWSIQDMNVVRKRLDKGKGGRLAEAAYPGDVLSLILSDVLGDPLDLIASGPTVCDTSNWMDAWNLVKTLPENALPPIVESLLQRGVDGKVKDSPPEDHPVFKQCENILVGNNALAVNAAATKAKALGYNPIVLGTQFEGEAIEVARFLVSLAQHARYGPEADSLVSTFPVALILGGETTVSLPPNCSGKGGRNQELALQACLLMRNLSIRNVVLASVGTDGTDGPTDAAGAIVDGSTIGRLQGSALESLRKHDAYTYLSQIDMNGSSPLLKVRTLTLMISSCILPLTRLKSMSL